MKKILVIFIACILVLPLAACGKKDADVKKQDNNTNQEEKTNNKSKNSEDELVSTYKVPSKEIYVDVPAYREEENAYTEVFFGPNFKYVTFEAERSFDGKVSDVTEAHKVAMDGFLFDMECYLVNSYTAEKEEIVNINGIEMLYFEGILHNGYNPLFDTYAVGYSFIMDGMPCQILGSFSDENNNPENKAELKALVTAMAKTVRNHE